MVEELTLTLGLWRRRFGDFHAWVLVNKLPGKVYSVEATDKRTIAYVESIEAAAFSVHLQDDQVGPQYGISGSVFVDGKGDPPDPLEGPRRRLLTCANGHRELRLVKARVVQLV